MSPVIGWRWTSRTTLLSTPGGGLFAHFAGGSAEHKTEERRRASAAKGHLFFPTVICCGRVKATPSNTVYRAREGNQSTKLQRGLKETNSEYNQRAETRRVDCGWTGALINPLLPVALGYFFFNREKKGIPRLRCNVNGSERQSPKSDTSMSLQELTVFFMIPAAAAAAVGDNRGAFLIHY